MSSERAVLAGGCFWGMQQLIRRLPGVVATRVGYSGGDVPNATYRNHGTHAARLLAFDLDNGEVIHDHRLPPEIAPIGSFLQDLQVSADGRTIVIADASFWRKSPAIIVYDIASATARRVL